MSNEDLQLTESFCFSNQGNTCPAWTPSWFLFLIWARPLCSDAKKLASTWECVLRLDLQKTVSFECCSVPHAAHFSAQQCQFGTRRVPSIPISLEGETEEAACSIKLRICILLWSLSMLIMFKPSVKEDCRVRAMSVVWRNHLCDRAEAVVRKAVCLFQTVGVSGSKHMWSYQASQVPTLHVASSQMFCGWQLLVKNRLKYETKATLNQFPS